MNILDIEIVNNRLIRCFMKQLNGDNLEISGDAGIGKTTAISALWDIMEKRADSVSHGQKKGSIRIKIGDDNRFIVATRENTPKTSSITIMDNDGKTISIADFKQMISDLSVNPHKICDMKSKQRTETLLKSADLGGFDLLKADAELTRLEAERLSVFRAAEALKTGPSPEKTSSVNISELIKKKDECDKTNYEYALARKALSVLQEKRNAIANKTLYIKSQIAALEKQLKDTNTELENIDKTIEQDKKYTESLTDIDVSPIVKQISTAEQTNRKATQYEAWEANYVKYQSAVDKHRELDSQVKDLASKRKTVLDSAKWPLDGLSIQDGEIIYNSSLFENLGESESMLVCAALAISDIKAHPIKVVRMDGVESMSKKDYDMLKTLFNGQGIQVLSTRVSRGDKDENEITIIEGEYKDTK